jgi:hypothetical protein
MHLPAAAGGDHESDNGSHGDLHEMSLRGEQAATMTPKTLDPKNGSRKVAANETIR